MQNKLIQKTKSKKQDPNVRFKDRDPKRKIQQKQTLTKTTRSERKTLRSKDEDPTLKIQKK